MTPKDIEFFLRLLSFDSTSGKEREVAEWLFETLEAPKKERFEVGDGTLNLLLSWGEPKLVFCTHMDTVPPYIPPRREGDVVYGRGSCDAKGQILAFYLACERLEAEGCSDFGLLLLSGEETGSWGAKAFSRDCAGHLNAETLLVGEPTENAQVTASKGTKSFALTFRGEAFHSGYPQYGRSAVALFLAFMQALDAARFPEDPILGPTTWNVGELRSDNPQNVLSPELRCRLYFRTTFASDEAVVHWMAGKAVPGLIEIEARGGDAPLRYTTLNSLPSAPASFGSDAPHLTGFARKMICGPGSIRHAHRADEQVRLSDIETAVEQCLTIYHHFVQE